MKEKVSVLWRTQFLQRHGEHVKCVSLSPRGAGRVASLSWEYYQSGVCLSVIGTAAIFSCPVTSAGGLAGD